MTEIPLLEMFMVVPTHLLDRVVDGTYRICGGTIRRSNGTIAGFLVEGWNSIPCLDQGQPLDSETLGASIGSRDAAADLTSVLGTLNLSFSAAGFSVMAKRLGSVIRRLGSLQDQMARTTSGIEWLRSHALDQMRADAENALATSERAARQKDHVLRQIARRDADGVRRKLVSLLDRMLADGTAITEHLLFGELFKSVAILANMEAAADDATEGPGQAATDLRAVVTKLRELSSGLNGKISDFASSPSELLQVGLEGRGPLLVVRASVRTETEILEGHIAQLELRDILGLDQEGWRNMTAPEGSGTVTCLAVPEGSDADLLEVARARPEVKLRS